MGDFKLKKHYVKKAYFLINAEKEKKNHLEIETGGNSLIPKYGNKGGDITVRLNLRIGTENERFYLEIETISVFEAENEDIEVSETAVQKMCVPAALASLRKTVKMVTEAYGMPAIDLPPFEGENY